MKSTALATLAVLVLSIACLAQNAPMPSQNFSITTSPISLPGNRGTFAGTDSGVTFNPTPNFDLANHNILSSDGKLSAFYGGADYTIVQLSKWMNDKMPKVSGFRLQPGIGAYFGVSRVKPGISSIVEQHYSALVNGKIAYSLDSGNHWQAAFTVGALRAPYYAKGWVPVVSVPFSYHF